MILFYFCEFGDRPCCLNDLQKYIDLLNQTEVSRLLCATLRIAGLCDDELPTTVRILFYSLFCENFHNYLL